VSHKKLQAFNTTDRAQLSLGMTFNVYNDNQGVERILHLDIIPRIILYRMDALRKGLQQRIRALNLFIQDIYNDKSHQDKIIPKELILSSASYLKQLQGFTPQRHLVSHYWF
jgi:uncharacterized circularly permuted ATP-grasp superfamily protein